MSPTPDQLRELHAMAKEARNAANCAYTIALQNRKNDDDSRDAFRTVVRTNDLVDRIYQLWIRSI